MKNRIILTAGLILTLLFAPITALAQGEGLPSVADIITKIEQTQGVTTLQAIDVSKVGADQLAELGDSVMEEVIGNTVMHEQMDARLGGDGSSSLADYHRQLAQQYLAGYPINRISLMSFGMMNNNYYQYEGGRNNMMGYDWMRYGGLGAILIGLAIVLIIVLVAALLVRRNHVPDQHVNRMYETKQEGAGNALAILAERYAKGEITAEEYAKMKSDLKQS